MNSATRDRLCAALEVAEARLAEAVEARSVEFPQMVPVTSYFLIAETPTSGKMAWLDDTMLWTTRVAFRASSGDLGMLVTGGATTHFESYRACNEHGLVRIAEGVPALLALVEQLATTEERAAAALAALVGGASGAATCALEEARRA